MEIFADKTVFIAGAVTDLAWRLLPVLRHAEARVILMDDDADELISMSRKDPTWIEPLPVEHMDAATCQVVGEIWEDEPIDIFLDFMALTEIVPPSEKLRASQALLTAFEPALMAADGCVVSIVPKSPKDDLSAQVAEAGQLQLAKSLAEKWQRWRVTYNVLRPVAGASASSMTRAVNVAVQAGWDNFTGVHIPIASAAH